MSTGSKRPQLSLDELHLLKWLLGGALALVSLWTVFFLEVEALGLVGIACAAVAAVLRWPQLPARAPRWVWWLSAPGIILIVGVDFYLSAETLPPLIRLAILLVLYRGVSYRRKREDLQLILLGLFLIVVAGVLTVSLGFAFLLLLFTACTLGFLFVVTMIETKGMGAEPAANSGPGGGDEPPGWSRLKWSQLFTRLREVADWRLLAFASGLFVVVVLLSGLLFLIIPRFEIATGFFLERYITKKSRIGFSETVRFGDVGELIRDESTALRVDLSDPATRPANPYWRLVVLDEYTPQGFKISRGLKEDLLRTQRVTASLRGRGFGRAAARVGGQWTFYVESGVSRFLPLPGSYDLLRLREPLPLQNSASCWLVALRTEPMTMSAYRLDGVEVGGEIPEARFGQLLAAAQMNGVVRQYDPRLTVRGPDGAENSAALQKIVSEILRGAAGRPAEAGKPPAEEFARWVCAWLADRHAYSLSVTLPRGGKDDIMRWVESNQPGFCEYFASAFTVLARGAGYPARVVAGFRGGTWNAIENYYQVKNADAHAWCEIYTERGMWLRVDPTPGGGGVANREEAAQTMAARQGDRSWSARLDSLRMVWYRRVVSFDQRTQVQMLEEVKAFTTGAGQALRAALEQAMTRLRAWIVAPWSTARAGKVAGWLVATGALAWAAWRAGREARWQWRRQRGKFDPVRQEAGRWLARLRTAGDECSAVHSDLLRLRYGPRETWAEPRAVFRRARRVKKPAVSIG